MNKDTEDKKRKFIVGECLLLTINAGLSTRNNEFPVYNEKGALEVMTKSEYNIQKNRMRNDLEDFLRNSLDEMDGINYKEEDHIKSIVNLSDFISEKYAPILHKKRFRIGVSQKLLNLFLKYMWSLGFVSEPFHCPIDGIVKSHIEKYFGKKGLVDWTSLDDISHYLDYIILIRQIIEGTPDSISVWELKTWDRSRVQPT